MPEFKYEGMNTSGRKEKGVVSAPNRDAASAILHKQGIIPLAIKESETPAPRTVPGFGSVSVQRLAEFTRKFAALVKTDIPISEIFEILGEEEEGHLIPEAARFVAREIAGGKGLGEAMRLRPRVFSPLYIRMVEAGINSGTLDEVAENLANLYEAENTLRKNLISKLIYPAVLLFLCFVLAFILRYIPGIFGADITFITPELFNGLLGFWLVVASLAIFGMTRVGYRIYREIGMRLPFLGDLMKKINLARFCRIFGLQFSAGVPILEALDTAKQVLQDGNIEKAVTGIQKRIHGGMDLRDAMIATGVFPKRMISMVGVGEKAGGVDQMLKKLAEYYELDIKTASTIMTTILYFVVFLAVAITIGTVVISGYMGYFSIFEQFM